MPTDNVAVPAEFPEAPPAPVTFQIQQPTIGRVVEVQLSAHNGNSRVRRPGSVVTAERGEHTVTATVLLDGHADTGVTGEPVPLAIQVRATHDDRDDAPPNTWRYPPRNADTVDVEQ